MSRAQQMDVMVVCFTGDSGLTDYSVSFCRELSRLAAIEFVTAASFDSARYGVDFSVVKIFRRTRHFPLDIWRFVAHVIRHRPRNILFQSWLKSPGLECVVLRLFRLFGIRVVLTIHDLLPHYPRPWSRFECRAYYKCFDALIVHSARQAAGLAEMGVHRPLLQVPHGVYDIFDTEKLSRSQARAFFPDLSSDNCVLLFFGHLDERKGLVEFLAAARLLEADARFRFVVAGKPDGRAATLAALAAARGRSNVLLHDYVIPHHEVQRYFAACDLVVLPYLEGTTSGVMKLALAFKRAVVCTDIGDFPETLQDWPGVLIDHRRMPESLVHGVLEAQRQMARLQGQTDRLAVEMQWSHIARRCLSHILPAEQPLSEHRQEGAGS